VRARWPGSAHRPAERGRAARVDESVGSLSVDFRALVGFGSVNKLWSDHQVPPPGTATVIGIRRPMSPRPALLSPRSAGRLFGGRRFRAGSSPAGSPPASKLAVQDRAARAARSRRRAAALRDRSTSKSSCATSSRPPFLKTPAVSTMRRVRSEIWVSTDDSSADSRSIGTVCPHPVRCAASAPAAPPNSWATGGASQ
jgi:hypothetical protein